MKDMTQNDTKEISEINGVDFNVFLDNTPIIKYENKEIAKKIKHVISSNIGERQVNWNDFMKYM